MFIVIIIVDQFFNSQQILTYDTLAYYSQQKCSDNYTLSLICRLLPFLRERPWSGMVTRQPDSGCQQIKQTQEVLDIKIDFCSYMAHWEVKTFSSKQTGVFLLRQGKAGIELVLYFFRRFFL